MHEEKTPRKRGPKPISSDGHVMTTAERGERFRQRQQEKQREKAITKTAPIKRSEAEMLIVNSEVASIDDLTTAEIDVLPPAQQRCQVEWEWVKHFNISYLPVENRTDRIHQCIVNEMADRYGIHKSEAEAMIEKEIASFSS